MTMDLLRHKGREKTGGGRERGKRRGAKKKRGSVASVKKK